jgi:AcrR family transcriptional regulator
MTFADDSTQVLPQTPARGTRPRNRRVITLAAATQLFAHRGYANVSMGDIAAATNVGASAIYRHFPGKSELLVATIRSGLAAYDAALSVAIAGDDGTDLTSLFLDLAECALAHRELGVLWQREARNLDDEQLRALREELVATSSLLSAHLAVARPELDASQINILAWCVLGALVSIGFHSVSVEHDRFVDLLAGMAETITRVSFDGDLGAAIRAAQERPVDESMRDSLIAGATELFAEKGFAAAGVDEIGSAVGIAGPSIYGHFSSKQNILVAAMQRGADLLLSETDRVLDSPSPAPVKLDALVDSYVSLLNRDRFLIRVLLSEMNQLPDEEREVARRQQRHYIATWVNLYREFTGTDQESARIRVQAVLLVVNDAIQTPHMRSQPHFEGVIRRIAKTMLELTH